MGALFLILAFLLALGGCGSADDQAEPMAPEEAHIQLFNKTVERALAMSEPRGWIVSRWSDGEVEHTGDSLLWTSMAMGIFDCERGRIPEMALLKMLEETGGRVYRHPAEAERPGSLDGHLGFYWGVSERVRRCPETADTWRAAMDGHKPYGFTAPFTDVLEAVRFQLGLSAKPSVQALQATVYGWAFVVVQAKAAGYRIHLGLLSYETLEASGVGVDDSARDTFCTAAKPAGMLTVEHYCGRGDLKGWADNFTYDQYEYRHQRAKWESADGKDGLHTPALDLLMALRRLYDLPKFTPAG